MISWGALLLAAYVVLGLSPMRVTKAMALAVCLTTLVVLAVSTGAWQ